MLHSTGGADRTSRGRARPLLFLDVDGTLLPFGAPSGDASTPLPATGVNPLLTRLDRRHGPLLAAMPCDPVWATTWMSDANDVIAPLLGWHPLPVVEWPDSDDDGPMHWKTAPLVAWAAGRPFVRVDDEITDIDRVWVFAHHPGDALLHRVDARAGITEQDLAAVRTWFALLASVR